MKAMVSRAPGNASTLILDELSDPAPADDEVLVRVRACGVNYLDALIIEDKYQTRPPRPFAPGAEISGVVEAVGKNAGALRVGNPVVAWTLWGGMAEKALVKAERCAAIPASIPFDVAAGLILTHGTSLHALRDRAQLKAGETLLVLGAAGGVGLAAVELGKAMGARVIAACSTEAKCQMALAHGADAGLVYPTGALSPDQSRALANDFKQACAPSGADVIYDPVGGFYTEAAVRAMAWGGRHLVVGFAADVPKLPLNLLLLKNSSSVGVYFGAVLERQPKAYRIVAAELLRLLEAGSIRPEISQRFPLERAGEAIAALNARAVGKIVVTMDL